MTKPSRVGRYWVYPYFRLPCGKRTKNYGKSPFFIGKFTISMVISHSDVKLPEGKPPFSYGFSMVFPLKPPFSYGFPIKTSMVWDAGTVKILGHTGANWDRNMF